MSKLHFLVVLGVCWVGCGDESGMLPSAMTPAGNGAGAAAPAAGSIAPGAAGFSGGAAPAAGSGTVGVAGVAGSTAGRGGVGGAAANGGAGGSLPTGGSTGAAGSGGTAGAAGASGMGDMSGSGGASGSAAGSGGAAGAVGAAGAAGMPAMRADLMKGDGHDVVLLGDSYMDNSLSILGTGGGIVPSLLRQSGQRYRNYAVQGTMLLMDNSYGVAIPKQWDQAKRANADVKTVVMTGGGNDIIQSSSMKASCMMGGAECKQLLLKERDRYNELWTAMADSGVQDVVRVMYATDTNTVAPALLMDPEITAPPPVCNAGKIRCYALPTNDLVKGERASDNIHPLASANDRMAKAIIELMEKEGMRR